MLTSTSHFGNNIVFSRKDYLRLYIGITIGLCFAIILLVSPEEAGRFSCSLCNVSHPDTPDIHRSHLSENAKPTHTTQPSLSVQRSDKEKKVAPKEDLSQKVRILCWILTYPGGKRRAKHVKKTWGKRCNILLFMSTQANKHLPTVVLDAWEGHEWLWGKTKRAFNYTYEHYLDKADWFLKADDDTYVVVENLRYVLQFHSPDEPIYFGRKFNAEVKQGYMSGGAGYVLSREALKRFVEEALPDPDKCWDGEGGAEDIEIGNCLQSVGVKPGVSRDKFGRGRFFPFNPKIHINSHNLEDLSWYWDYTNTSSAEGDDCCSDTAISFHYIKPQIMHVLDYCIYHLRPYGIYTRISDTDPSHNTVY